MKIEIRKPLNCSESDLEKFYRLVCQGGEVEPTGLKNRIKNARVLIFLNDEEILAGVAALKQPNEKYKRSVFKKAGVLNMASAYSIELGWIFLIEQYRGRNLSRQLVGAAITEVPHLNLFATSRSDNIPIHKTLKRFGFTRVSNPYLSGRNENEFLLFIRGAASDLYSANASK